jgi:hypothetical protein
MNKENKQTQNANIDPSLALLQRVEIEIRVMALRLRELNQNTLDFGRKIIDPRTDTFCIAIQILVGLQNELMQNIKNMGGGIGIVRATIADISKEN